MGRLLAALAVPTTTILFLAALRCCSSSNSTNSTYSNNTTTEEDFTAAMKLTAYRHLQFPGRAADVVTLHFSLWFPTQNDPSLLNVDALIDDTEHPTSLGVVQAVERLLCQETNNNNDDAGEDWIVTEHTDTSDGTSALQTYNVCQRYHQQRSSSSSSSGSSSSNSAYNAPSILYRHPNISILKTTQENDNNDANNNETATTSASSFTWTVWSLQYGILQVGDVFVQEAIMNNADLLISEIQDAAVTAMQQVLQLTLEVAIMEGQFDEILLDELPTVAYSALVEQEWPQWQAAEIDFEASYSFTPQTWYPMRIAGLVLWTLTLATYLGLYGLSNRRRRRRLQQPSKQPFDARQKQPQPQSSQRQLQQHAKPSHSLFQPVVAENDDEQVQLVHPASVDQMLHQSSRHWLMNNNISKNNNNTVNPYFDSAWDEMPWRVQEAAMILGYTSTLWNQKQRSPRACESKSWHQLTVAEQQAAAVFGFNQVQWDDAEEKKVDDAPFVVS